MYITKLPIYDVDSPPGEIRIKIVYEILLDEGETEEDINEAIKKFEDEKEG